MAATSGLFLFLLCLSSCGKLVEGHYSRIPQYCKILPLMKFSPVAVIVPRMSIKGVDFRAAINARLKELDQSKYWLVQQLKGEEGLSERTVYSFLRGDSDLRASGVARILDVLDLKIVPKSK
jgi:hypothetical protein